MKTMKRKEFIKQSVLLAGGATIAPAYLPNMITNSPNERINIAVIGISGKRKNVRGMINGRGMTHIEIYAGIPNVTVKTLCDVDERLFTGAASTVEKLFGSKPNTVFDFRKLLDDKDLDVISIATPDHWHALMTVWHARQARMYMSKNLSVITFPKAVKWWRLQENITE